MASRWIWGYFYACKVMLVRSQIPNSLGLMEHMGARHAIFCSYRVGLSLLRDLGVEIVLRMSLGGGRKGCVKGKIVGKG